MLVFDGTEKTYCSIMLTRYDVAVNEEPFIEFKYILKTEMRSLDIQDNIEISTIQLFQPLL